MVTVGSRLRSQVCGTELVLVKGQELVDGLTCGGHPVLSGDEGRDPDAVMTASSESGNAIGKRYVDATGGLEVLVTKSGGGLLALNGEALTVKQSKALPSSD